MKNRYKSNKKKSRFSKQSSGSNAPAYLIFFITFLVIAVGAFAYFKAENEISSIGEDFCRKDYNSAITVILIDHTDKLNTIQRASLETRLWNIAKSIPKNSLIKVYSVGRTTDKPLNPIFEGCNPGDQEKVSNLTGNKRIAEKRYRNGFMDPLKLVLNKIVEDRSDTESPIMESVQSVSVTTFLEEKNSHAEKTLILVSDLLQHSNGFSLYKGTPEFNSFKTSSYGRSIEADLAGVNVEILFLNRMNAGSLQNPTLRRFWREYFNNQGAHIRHEVTVEG